MMDAMAVNAETIRTHIAFTTWASRRLVEAAATLSEEELTRDFQTSDRSVLGTLAHVYAADRVWLGRIEGRPPARFLDPEVDLKLAVLQNQWPALLGRWGEWAAGLSDADAEAVIAYKDLKGNPYSSPLWQIVLHVVNHGTHHRGQVSGFLRSMGYAPPALDLIAYYRQMK
jgi:uncharacterized damage-inducible protein DinB